MCLFLCAKKEQEKKEEKKKPMGLSLVAKALSDWYLLGSVTFCIGCALFVASTMLGLLSTKLWVWIQLPGAILFLIGSVFFLIDAVEKVKERNGKRQNKVADEG